MRELFSSDGGFFVRAGAFAGFAALLCHSIYDVPAYYWATAGFGLALLAIARPLRARTEPRPLARSACFLPFAIGGFWLLPILTVVPAWSPVSLDKILHASATTPTLVSTDELENEIRYFPLDANLHQALGLRFLTHGQASRGWDEFRIADKLDPISWQLPATQAWIGGQYSPGISLHFWALALERAGHRAQEIFPIAYQRTAATSPKFWATFAREHPEFLGIYSESVSDPTEARAAYEEWWKIRGAAQNLAPFEVRYFYSTAAKWGTAAQLEAWMNAHPDLAASDFEDWAELLHHWKDDAAAWRVLAARIQEPAFPPSQSRPQTEALEANWFAHPSDLVTRRRWRPITRGEAMPNAAAKSLTPSPCKKMRRRGLSTRPRGFTRKAATTGARSAWRCTIRCHRRSRRSRAKS